MKLLLHACCAPCAFQCVAALSEEGIKPDLCWYNPNIHPYTEYHSRLDSLRRFAQAMKLSLVTEDEYGLRSFIKAVSSMEEKDERASFGHRTEGHRTEGHERRFLPVGGEIYFSVET